MKFKGVINFPDVQTKRRFLAQVGALSEPHEIELKPYRPRRSNRANAFYWAGPVTALIQFFAEQNEVVSAEYCHDLLVRRCLGERELILPDGTVEKVRMETHRLNTAEFSEFVEKSIAWLGQNGIEVPPYAAMANQT